MSGAYDEYGYATAPGGLITAELVAETRLLNAKWAAHKKWVDAICNPAGGFDATKLQGPDFLVVAGDEQAFHDDVIACADGIASAIASIDGNMSKIGRGS